MRVMVILVRVMARVVILGEGDGDTGEGDGEGDGDTGEGDGVGGDTSEGGDYTGESDREGNGDDEIDGGSDNDDNGDDGESKSDGNIGGNNTTDNEVGFTPLTNPSPSNPTSNPSSDNDKASIGIFSSGIAVAVSLALVFLALITFLIVYVKRKTKLAMAVQIEDSYEHNDTGGAIGEKHLDNPTYNTNLEFPPCSHAVEDTERNLVNPLYGLKTEAEQKQCNPRAYAILECPIPGEGNIPDSQSDSEPAIPDFHDYDYVDIPADGI